MGKVTFTKKQNDLMRLFKQNKLPRLTVLQGSVRSGKTWISLILWALWVASRPRDYLYMMTAKSLQTLKRNCLLPLQELIGERNFTFSLSAKEGVLFGRKIMLEGANDARSENKIRGITLGGAYCDELTLFPEDFFIMLLSTTVRARREAVRDYQPGHAYPLAKEKVPRQRGAGGRPAEHLFQH